MRRGTEIDLDALSSLNKRLNDEFYPEIELTDSEVSSNILELMHAGHDAYLFEVGGKPVGFGIVRRGSDPLAVRMFYMGKEARGRGYNNLAVILLEEATNTSSIDADARVWKAA